jgi:capsular polysaccharide export protein
MRQGDAVGFLPDIVHALGFSVRKRNIVRQFLPEYSIRFALSPEAIPDGALVAVWGSSTPEHAAAARRFRTLRMEDGFLRSVGLGADLVAPLSWVVDGTGIYYDATRPSDLESLLAAEPFGADLLLRAARYRAEIVASGLTKYNVGRGAWQRPSASTRVVLVPGQVEQDASVRFGSPTIKSNLDLLATVRAACPDAYVIYKPHPDVLSGLRRGGVGEHQAAHWCDEVVEDVDMGSLLQEVDEVHTLTSLAGFEALLRGKRVVAYGQPFYAGWGLTEDLAPVSRRTRRLSLDELVAGALLLYPRYLSRRTGELIAAEAALDELLAWRSEAGAWARQLKNPARAPVRRILRWAERRR